MCSLDKCVANMFVCCFFFLYISNESLATAVCFANSLSFFDFFFFLKKVALPRTSILNSAKFSHFPNEAVVFLT